MSLMTWTNEKIKKMDVWDIGALKIYCALIGIVIGAYIAGFVKQYLWYFIALIVLLAIKLCYKFFKK